MPGSKDAEFCFLPRCRLLQKYDEPVSPRDPVSREPIELSGAKVRGLWCVATWLMAMASLLEITPNVALDGVMESFSCPIVFLFVVSFFVLSFFLLVCVYSFLILVCMCVLFKLEHGKRRKH